MLYVSVDPDGTIEEENEENNLAPAALEVTVPSLPDLSVSAESILLTPESPLQGDPVQISVTVTNLGTAAGTIPVRIYLGDPDDGGTLISARTLYGTLSLGQAATVDVELETVLLEGTHSIHVVVDPADIITESNEENNTASVDLPVLTAGMETTITSDKAVYDADEEVELITTAVDSAGVSRDLTWNLSILDDTRNLIAVIVQDEPVTIGAGASVSMTRTWNTGDSLAGGYTATAEFFENGRMIARSKAAFVIAPDPAIDSGVTADKIAYEPDEIATIQGAITSLSRNYIFENLTARVSIHAPDGDLIVTEDKQVRMLMPEAVISFNTVWDVAASPKGNYDITLEVVSGEDVLTESSSSFEVLGSGDTGSGLTATLTPPADAVCQGQRLDRAGLQAAAAPGGPVGLRVDPNKLVLTIRECLEMYGGEIRCAGKYQA
jgi:hypothetical protein